MACVVLSLLVRVVHRGPYLSGWDVLSAAQGLVLISTLSPGEIVDYYWSRGYYWAWTVWNLYAIPVVLVPGALASLWPWDHWNVVGALATTLASFALIRWALALSLRETGALVLAWGASSTLLSWSVAGLAYVSCFLPHALALATVLRLASRPVWTLVACVVIHALAWHGQELGQSVFVVLLAAAIFLRGAPRSTRTLWVATGVWQLWTTLSNPSHQQSRFLDFPWPGWGGLFERVWEVARQLASPGLDSPPFLLLGLGAVLLIHRDRWFWWAVVGAQLGLVLSLGLSEPSFVWPRRFLLVSAYSAVVIALLYRDCGLRRRQVLAALLVAANLWQLVGTIHWASTPLRRPGVASDFPLPYSHTTMDYDVSFAAVDWYLELRRELASGKKLVLIYNQESYLEDATIPTGILERLYLTLGHDEFVRSVQVFGRAARWTLLPIRHPDELQPFVASIDDPSEWVVHRCVHPADKPGFVAESREIEDALLERFDLDRTREYSAPTIGGEATFSRYELVPR